MNVFTDESRKLFPAASVEAEGRLFPLRRLTGTLGLLDDRPEAGSAAQVSASIRVKAVKRERCRAKGQREEKEVSWEHGGTAAAAATPVSD